MDCIKPIFIAKQGHDVPCGRCPHCLMSKMLDWSYRLEWEQRNSNSSKFITLTYSDEYLPIDTFSGAGTLDKTDLQKFFKRLRKVNDAYAKKDRKPIRYFAVGEYGTELQRPHYHIILFNAEREAIARLPETWPIGQIDIGRVTPSSIGYVASHSFHRQLGVGTVQPAFALMSRKPGIGYNYLQSNSRWHKSGDTDRFRFHVTDNGHSRRLPRYYKDKIFTGAEKLTYNQRLQIERERRYESIIDQLRPNYSDPYAHYEVMVREAADAIVRKSKKNRKLND